MLAEFEERRTRERCQQRRVGGQQELRTVRDERVEAFSRLTEICCRIIAGLPQSKVVVEPFLVGCDAVGIEELGAPVALVVVPQRPCGDRQVGPGGTPLASGGPTRLRGHRPSSSIKVFGAHASPWHTTSRSTGKGSVTHGGGPNAQSSTGSASRSTRRPRASRWYAAEAARRSRTRRPAWRPRS